MTAKLPPFPLPRLVGGINRFDAEAGPEQIVDGLDVFEDDGELRRRPAFYTQAVGTWRELPAGLTALATGGAGTETLQVHRRTTLNGADQIYVGSRTKFDGILWPYLSSVGTTTAPRRLTVQFNTGGGSGEWSDIAAHLDTTWTQSANGPHSLTRPGTVTWHRTTGGYDDWSAADLTGDGEDLFWVRIAFVWAGSEAAQACGNIVMEEPGVLALKLRPVDSIMPHRTRSGPSLILAGGSKRWDPTESGAGLGRVVERGENRPLLVMQDEGAGVVGSVSVAEKVYSASAGAGFYTGSKTEEADDTFSIGTADNLTKFDDRYEWFDGQFKGGAIYGQISSTHTSYAADPSFDQFTLPLVTTNHPLAQAKADELRGCILRVTVSGSGPAVNERVQIITNTAPTGSAVTVLCYPRLSVAPTASTRFEVVPFEFRAMLLSGEPAQYTISGHASANPGDRALLAQTNFDPEVQESAQGLFQIGIRTADIIRGGRWSSTWEPTTKELYLTNGRSGILKFDGKSLRRASAVADPENARVQEWIGTLPDQAREQLSSRTIAGSQLLARIPQGEFIQEFWGRLVVGKIDGEPYGVAWSAPSPDTDLWPTLYRTQVRDDFNNEITGMLVLGDRLFVFTPTTIFGTPAPGDDGLLRFGPVSRGMGFLAHHAVVKVDANTAIGINADGIYAFSGYEPTPILDEWERLLPGGVNRGRLKNAVGAASYFDNTIYFAVPSAGSSVNDRLIVYDYTSQAFWVWSAPFGGISAIARDFNEFGNEVMLFGHEDGHITTLREGPQDDGESVITGRARSQLIPLTQSLDTIHPSHMLFQMKETGENVSIATYPNGIKGNTDYTEDWNNPRVPQAVWGTGVYGTATWAGEALYVNDIRVDASETCQSLAFEISGAGQWRYRRGTLFLPQRTARDRG